MKMVDKKYSVPIVRDSEDTWSRIHMRTQPLSCLYDDGGNLSRCCFERIQNELLGDFYIFSSLDRKVAEEVSQKLHKDEGLNVLPIIEVLDSNQH